ncbi:MAG: YebC/PmpR family DNA-binding transcriptional regulator [Candidatus Marinimicrobia bacterium]|jgi:YebC/PmpR family DNA-binding regulatory protein|nr:YebC/PmpR family DNA-binding transcriptional regulator [Candidatus Neomarinimicrobiota bacterium]MBT3630848.1 YebC/PmpR family DNA-binding transcriptional regulator [Candidatus Neomarinimicrobiota bacterium]MBT3825222.1 YebC/PmpR family DNA-binding transcriptional regulator [Candidatus Neomarinimicrobiota bacterium]MBT4132546.1 YebC/PmpR family DNA-binding transcriptional regulator [Candidatus Neomarinimicrobiota bacterium]MBT4296427.1 YebC/PmpR family DNA-binding transcriptional regulator [
MSGHSKWSTIKRKKAVVDAARGKVFTRIAKELTIAARAGGGEESTNPRLRTAISTAKSSNMPTANIERAIKKGTGDLEGVIIEEIIYEGYGPGGVALMMEVATDNRNRTVSEIRHLLSKHGGNLAQAGAVGWMFDNKGVLHVPADDVDEDELMMAALEGGAEDMSNEGDFFEILSAPNDLNAVNEAVVEAGYAVEVAQIQQIPNNFTEVSAEDLPKVVHLMELLDDHDDMQKLSASVNFTDEMLAGLE